MKGNSQKVIALLTAFVLCFGILLPAAHTLIPSSEQNLFPAPEQNDNAVYEPQSPVASDKYHSRDELEAIADLAGGNKTHTEIEAMDDAALGAYIEENLGSGRFDGILNAQDPTDKQSLAENRDALEEIAVILGGNNVQDMSQSELQEFVEDKLDAPLPTVGQDNAAVEELVQKDDIREPIADPAAKQENEAASPEQTDYEEKKDAFNEDGEIVKPFDEVFPEYMETEAVGYDEETVLIRLSVDSDGKVTSAMKKAGVAKLEKMFATEESVWYEAFLKKGTDIREAVTALRAIDEIELVEYNFTIRTTAMDDYEELEANVTSNKLVAHQWHLNYCGFSKGSKLLDNAGGDPSVIVAVIDTGVDYNHEDLHDNIWVNEKEIPDNGMDDDENGYVDDYYGVNIITGSGNGGDDNGHGTHVAGIIAAQNNHLGTVGIAYNTKIMPIKAAMASGTLHQSDIAKAILYAYENGAEVINMSFGGTTCSIAVQDALATAYTRCVLVASAGNEGAVNENFILSIPNYPAALSYVVGVMSVGRSGIESSFSNFDYAAFTSCEYEVYAPGEEIISTVPGNKYASWSGTSMAAPMVSAIAALVRSRYPDRNTYPTKFIYGQITATSDNTAVCPGHPQYGIEPGKHNIPAITNLHAALTKIPTPEVGLSEYYVFDTSGFEADTAAKNNGDGVIDAGETLALGMILRNRWGMSKNTIVTVDTLSLAGIADPYIEILNPTVDYGSVGTYSTGDCGKLFTDELFTGWEDPFYIHIQEDCPNDYIFRINVNITCENALDEDDDTVYTSGGTIVLTVRNGYVLPSVISEDMTLTPDNLYIIPNATTILKGATVTVEPGTHIQFWSDDAEDPYADEYIAYLRVEGKFLVEGTAEDPVYIYPSDLMSQYTVTMFEVNTDSSAENYSHGTIEIHHADITNFSSGWNDNRITLLSDCILRKNTPNSMHYRYLYNGSVGQGDTYTMGYFNAVNCAFYKISNSYYNQIQTGSSCSFDTCAFIDCGIRFSGQNRITNCVLYGNNFNSDTHADDYINSSYTAQQNLISSVDASKIRHAYVPETGSTYVAIHAYEADEYKEFYKWNYAVFETEQEFDRVRNFNLFTFNYYGSDDYGYDVGIYFENDIAYWSDGTPVGDFIQKNGTDTYLSIGYKILQRSTTGYVLFEIPGEIYVTDITFSEFEIDLDLETEYIVKPVTQPVPFEAKDLLFESANESIVTVDGNGLVTPVAKGSTDIYVYSKDKKVSNYVTVNVVDYVALEDLSFDKSTQEIEIGTAFTFVPSFTPANTTRKNVTFTSSAPEIISVDSFGTAKALARGEAVISMTCEGITKEITVSAYKKTRELNIVESGKVFLLNDGTAPLPQITYGDADVNLQWKSSDDSVLTVQDGRLVFNNSGRVILKATDSRSGLSDEITLYVTSDNQLPAIKKLDGGNYQYVLFENGDAAQLNQNGFVVIATGIKDLGAQGGCLILLKEDGSILYTYCDSAILNPVSITWLTQTSLDNIQKVFAGNDVFFAVNEDGICYAWGQNRQNCSGTGIIGTIETPKMVNLEHVTDVYSNYEGLCYTYFRTDDGNVYYAGGDNEYAQPTLVAENVSKFDYFGRNNAYAMKDGRWYDLDRYNFGTDPVFINDTDGHSAGYVIEDGIPYFYAYQSSTEKKRINGITNAVAVFDLSDSWYARYTRYILCADGTVFGSGDNYNGALAGGASEDTADTEAVIVPLFNYSKDTLALEKTNLTATETADGSFVNVLKNDKLTLDINGKLKNYTGLLYADGQQIPCQISGDFDCISLSLKNGFKEGVIYRFVIEPNSIGCEYLSSMQQTLHIEFTFSQSATEEVPEEEDPEKVSFREAVIDESIERYYVTVDEIVEKANEIYKSYNPYFHGNVILNRISTDYDVDHWLRVLAPESNSYSEVALGGNYWGTTNERAIGLQLIDYTDFQNYAMFNYVPFLTTAPENTFPFVTDVKIFNEAGEEVTTVGNEKITVRVTFNRDMDESIDLSVCFGSSYPYAEYEISGAYTNARTWEGTTTLTTVIENGNQYFTISNGRAKDTCFDLFPDRYRFGFVIDTTAAQALIMQGSATDEGIELTWTQDDFDTLMGYNVYRSTSEDGFYQRLNASVIPDDTKTFFDDTVEPGVVYYYNFTVVQTDLTESVPSGKISIMSKDTMAPDIFHTPVYLAKTDSNIIISAIIKDNLLIHNATVYYRRVGETEWKMAVMNKLNDKYSAIIYATEITTDGIEYYIEAFDGITRTSKASADNPYTITVQEALGDDALGDVNGDGKISNLDALMLLQAINDLLNLDADQFARADLNADGELSAAEALRILQYVNGTIGSVRM